MCSFRIGQKVVCTKAPLKRYLRSGEVAPTRGTIYTVRGIDPPRAPPNDFISIWLVEIVNPTLDYGTHGMLECTFDARKFRPLVERKTDISIFTKMLDGSRVLETTVTKG